jgi:hypothetical protein
MTKLVSSGHPKNNMVLTSVQHPITKLIKQQLLTDKNEHEISVKGVKLKMFNQSKDCFHVCCVEHIDDYNLLIEPVDAVTTATLLSADYFVYGQEIEDFHCMNNSAVFSTLVSAFQALDNKCKLQEEIINKLIKHVNLVI